MYLNTSILIQLKYFVMNPVQRSQNISYIRFIHSNFTKKGTGKHPIQVSVTVIFFIPNH